MEKKIIQGLKILGDYFKREFYKFADSQDRQSREIGQSYLENIERGRNRERNKEISTFGYHLSTINPTDFKNLLEDIVGRN